MQALGAQPSKTVSRVQLNEKCCENEGPVKKRQQLIAVSSLKNFSLMNGGIIISFKPGENRALSYIKNRIKEHDLSTKTPILISMEYPQYHTFQPIQFPAGPSGFVPGCPAHPGHEHRGAYCPQITLPGPR